MNIFSDQIMSLCRLAYRNPHLLRCSAFMRYPCLENSTSGRKHGTHINCIRRDYCRPLKTQICSDWSDSKDDGSSKQGRTLSMSVLGLFSLAFWRKEDVKDEEEMAQVGAGALCSLGFFKNNFLFKIYWLVVKICQVG